MCMDDANLACGLCQAVPSIREKLTLQSRDPAMSLSLPWKVREVTIW